ncbi:MAG: hypothetical protein AAF447_15060 [Myxococcota bacterium]
MTMRAASAALGAETTQLRHFLLFSVGSDSEQLVGTAALGGAAARAGITTSVVSMGTGPDTPALERFSRLGGGRFYIVDDLRELPRIFTQETLEASRAALVEEPFRPRSASPSAVLAGVDLESAPTLGGYALVNTKSRARTLIRASDEDPLLAVWQYGVGRAAVFATDVGAELGRSWLRWPGYGTLFGQLGRALSRAPERRDARLHVTIEGGVGRVVVEAVSDAGRTRNYLELRGVVTGPGGEGRPLRLEQSAPGRYEARFPADAPGPYLVTVREDEEGAPGAAVSDAAVSDAAASDAAVSDAAVSDAAVSGEAAEAAREQGEGEEATALLVGSAGVVRPDGGELRGAGTDRALLERLAALTGGTLRASLSEVFQDRPPRTWSHAPMAPALLRLALVLLVLGVALRRLAWPWRRRAASPGDTSPEVASSPGPQALTKKRWDREPREARDFVPVAHSAAAHPAPTEGPEAAPEENASAPEEPPAARSLAERLLAEKKKN